MATPPPHHLVRPTARDAVARLAALVETLGSRSAVYDLVGGVEHFERLVVNRDSVSAYLGTKQRLPGMEMLPRLLCFLEAVEPTVTTGTPPSPRTLRAQLEATLTRRLTPSAQHGPSSR